MTLSGEVCTNLEELAVIGEEGPVISFFVNLVQSVIGVLVPFE